MSALIERNRKFVRPQFNYAEYSSYSDAAITAQMSESIRNVLEGIAASQMLQCDVAHAIKEIRDILKKRSREDEARYLQKRGFKKAASALRKRRTK